jgi:hypothetical protein
MEVDMMNFEQFDNAINEEQLKQINEAKSNTNTTDLPDGNYTVKVENMELGATKDGRPMLKVQMRIIDGKYKKCCLFMNRVIYGTKNDANAIASVLGWLAKLETETVPEFKSYSQFAENVLDIFEEVADSVELDVEYKKDAFNSITIKDVYDAE